LHVGQSINWLANSAGASIDCPHDEQLNRMSIMCFYAERPSSATASAAAVERTVRSRFPATLERTAERPFAAAPLLGDEIISSKNIGTATNRRSMHRR